MTDYSKIFSASPINATAAKVVSQSGIQWEPEKEITRPWDTRSEAPLPTRPFSGPKENDFTGQRRGRLVVVGYAHNVKSNSRRGAAWVVRCACGYYEIRRTKMLKNTPEARSMCSHCDHFEQMKLGKTIPEYMKAGAVA